MNDAKFDKFESSHEGYLVVIHFSSHLPSRVLRKRVGGNSKEADFMAHPKVFVTLSKHEKLMVIIAIKQKYNCFAQPKTF